MELSRPQRTFALAVLALSIVSIAACSSTASDGGSNGGSGSGGTTAQGGRAGSGGVTGSGGQSATGGASATGGHSATGGQTGTGGASAQDGTGTGGSAQTGGTTSTAGAAGSGGRTGSGGTSAAGGAAGRDAGPDLAGATGGNGAGGQTGQGGSGETPPDAGSGSAAVPSAGCGKTPTLTSGSRTIQSGGQNRSFMLRIPANYDNSHPYPLLFAFHWNGGTMGDVDGGGTSGYTWSYYGLREQADNSTSSKMIFVAPQGNGNGWANSGGQDLTLVDDLIKQIEADLCVDTSRLFSMGFSYGGGMTYAIACARASVFRAAAVYAGAQLSGCTDGTKPIAYIGFHSITDPTCNISGGRSLRDKFVTNNGCTPQTPPEPSQGSKTHLCTSYAGCSAGHPVRWCPFDGGGHTPAPVDGQSIDSGGGDKTWTKGEAWKFFTQF